MASLAEELKLLSLPAPGKIVLDELYGDLTSARVVSRDEVYKDDNENKELGRSNLRRKGAILLVDEDTRYAGEATSRKDLMRSRGDNDDEQLEKGSSGSENESEQGLTAIIDENYEFDEFSEDQYGSEDSENVNGEKNWKSDEKGSDDEAKEEEVREEEDWEGGKVEGNEEGLKKFSHSEVDEVKKGTAIVHQIAIWDSLLENRIRFQKMLIEVNKLPQHDVMSKIKEEGASQIKDLFNNTQQLLSSLLHNLLILQQTLYEKNSETVGILGGENKSSESDEDILSDDEGDNDEEDSDEETSERKDDDNDTFRLPKKRKRLMNIDEYLTYVTKRHAAFEPFRDATIKKWNEKTRLASGKVNSKSFNSFDRSTLNQIKQILSDRERLIKRTQLKRSSYRILGKTEVNECNNDIMEQHDVHLKNHDSEIFDDDDFYHQLLREFIERKSTVDPNDPIAMGRQWLEIQRLRNKAKRKVDTKASKGRRLRYDVHPKLVSFMAPQNRGSMADFSRNELFSSLFGKRQPQDTADVNTFR